MIKDETQLFTYIGKDFIYLNIVDSYPNMELREVEVNVLKKVHTSKQIFIDKENQWVTQEEVISFVKNVQKDTFRKEHLFLLKSGDKFFVAIVQLFLGNLRVDILPLSSDTVWSVSRGTHIVLPTTKPL